MSAVDTAFELLLAEIIGVISDLRKRGSEELRAGNYGVVEMLMKRASTAEKLQADIERIEAEWDKFTTQEIARPDSERYRQPQSRSVPFPGKLTRAPSVARGTLPPEGTLCRFKYKGSVFEGEIVNGMLAVSGAGEYPTFSTASKQLTGTSRNGWRDWELKLSSTSIWILADKWRRRR